MRTFMLLVGFACAIGVGVLFGRSTEPEPQRQAVRVRAPEPVVERPVPPAETPVVAAAPASDVMDPVAILEALLREPPSDARAEQVRRLAEAIRSRALQEARSAEGTAARKVADEIEKERKFREDLERGGTMAFLRKLKAEPRHLIDLVSDAERFATLTERRIDGGVILGTSLRGGDPIEDGTVLHFPAGAHEWKISRLGGREDFPDDLLVRGDGMDATLVRLDEVQARGEVRSLTFQDCTIDCGNDYFTDLRSGEPVSIRLERCRVVRFDMGAGGSLMLAARTAAFHAIDCRIEAGFGRSPGSGNLFRVRSGLLVRMERCTFVGPFRSVYDKNKAATYVFEDCRFEQQEVPLEDPPEGVRFLRCTATPPPAKRPDKSRPLSDLNPDWKTG